MAAEPAVEKGSYQLGEAERAAELTLQVRRRVHTFFLSGSRTPQCLSKSHSLSEHRKKQDFGSRGYLAAQRILQRFMFSEGAKAPSVLTGGHLVVRSWGSVAWHCWGKREVLPLALGGRSVAGWRSARRRASMGPGWISEGWGWRVHWWLQRRRLLEN